MSHVGAQIDAFVSFRRARLERRSGCVGVKGLYAV